MVSAARTFDNGPEYLRSGIPVHGVYFARPAKALTSSSELKRGMEIWLVHLKFDHIKRAVIQKLGTLDEIRGERDWHPSGMWFTTTPHEISAHSCHDFSLDGATYNDNYIFASGPDATEALANKERAA